MGFSSHLPVCLNPLVWSRFSDPLAYSPRGKKEGNSPVILGKELLKYCRPHLSLQSGKASAKEEDVKWKGKTDGVGESMEVANERGNHRHVEFGKNICAKQQIRENVNHESSGYDALRLCRKISPSWALDDYLSEVL